MPCWGDSGGKQKKDRNKRSGGQRNPKTALASQDGSSAGDMGVAATSEGAASDTHPALSTAQNKTSGDDKYVSRLGHRKVTKKALERQLSESSENVKRLEEDLRRLKETESKNAWSWKSKIQTLEGQLSESSLNIKRLKDDLKKKDEEMKMFSSRLRETAASNDSKFKAKIQTLEGQLSESSDNIKRPRDDLRKKEEKTKMLASRLHETASTTDSSLKAKVQTLEDQLSESTENIKQLQEGLRKKDEEMKMLASRLSEMASKNVSRSSNVFLEDLSTQNRPMKIAEEFEQDLYGSVWFLALESLLKINDRVEEDVCTRLLFRILMVVYQKCKDELHKAIVSANSFLNPGFDCTSVGTSVTTDRKADTNKENAGREIKLLFASNISLASTDVIKERYLEDILAEARKSPELQARNWRMSGKHVTNFVEVCSKICRMMLVQDPPMALISYANKDGSFNPNLFSCYGHKGQTVDFLVWPALLLYDGGPVMSKGAIKCK